MNKIRLIKELSRYPVFNIKILKELTGKSREYAKLIAYRLKKESLIYEIERNKYASQKDPLIMASNIIWPSYISLWSSLRYYNLTEQLPKDVFVITTRARKKRIINLENSRIIFIRINPKYFFGYNKEIYNGFDVFIAEKEKALIDSALFKKISFSEICEIVKKNKENLDIDLLAKYLIKTRNKSLIKRFGFLLETMGFNYYNKFKASINHKYTPLEYAIKAKGEKIKKWRIIKNVDI
ncbi:hypothetical protein FJZ19_01845 [Candidatus Pacearchaeota archaeon]|nr:hypothetical protein [Candidatus Pacearchaeota archaeon]